MEIVVINKTVWTVGLRWDKPQKRLLPGHAVLLREARDLDEKMDADAAAHLRTPKGVQHGFGSVGDSWKLFAPAPALCACLDVPASFLGLFRLRTSDGRQVWWLHLRVGGVVAELGDTVFISEEEARGALDLYQLFSTLTPEVHETPEDSAAWLGARLRSKAFDRIVLGRGALANLKAPLSRNALRRLVAVVLVCALAGGAVSAWRHFAEQAAQEAARQAHLARLQRKADLETHPEKFFKMAWQNAPLAVDMASGCLPAMMAVPLSSNGWEFHDAVCTGKKVNIAWKHASGADFVLLPDGAHLDEKNQQFARSSVNLQPIPVKRTDGKGTNHSFLLTREEVTGILSEITQATGTKLSPISFGKQEEKKIDKIPVVAPWHKCQWELSRIPDVLMTVSAGPDGVSLFHMLAEIPGLTLDAITFDGNWSIKGTVYAKH